jgi:Polyketide cyclase / dehydrase and lipid transport
VRFTTNTVEWSATLEAPCGPAHLYRYVADLGTYPQWLALVDRAAPSGEGGWLVDLRARVGPFARSKRLRMLRTVHETPRLVVFERRENDGKRHADWVLRAEVAAAASGSRLVMHLTYSGGLLGAVVERILEDQIDDGRRRLLALIAADPANT